MFLNQDAKKEKAILNKINFVRNQDRCIYSYAVFVFIIFLIPNDYNATKKQDRNNERLSS